MIAVVRIDTPPGLAGSCFSFVFLSLSYTRIYILHLKTDLDRHWDVGAFNLISTLLYTCVCTPFYTVWTQVVGVLDVRTDDNAWWSTGCACLCVWAQSHWPWLHLLLQRETFSIARCLVHTLSLHAMRAEEKGLAGRPNKAFSGQKDHMYVVLYMDEHT